MSTAGHLGAATPLGEPLLDATAVAAFLGVDKTTIYRLAGRPNGLPVIQIAPRVHRFRPEDVRAFLAARTKSPQMAVEARQLLDAIGSASVELPPLPGRVERPSRPARGACSRAPGGGP